MADDSCYSHSKTVSGVGDVSGAGDDVDVDEHGVTFDKAVAKVEGNDSSVSRKWCQFFCPKKKQFLIHFAIRNECTSEETVRALLSRGASTMQRDGKGLTAFHLAVLMHRTKAFLFLLSQPPATDAREEAAVACPSQLEVVCFPDALEQTPLDSAVTKGTVDSVSFLLDVLPPSTIEQRNDLGSYSDTPCCSLSALMDWPLQSADATTPTSRWSQ
eukprot:c17968_g1_i3.p1 GENE.c17968_g1_i3~~c17968_g1_i3.p1  ORF type:complete len:215 (+),score=24.40 c17968_g1_i3:76-720(+)